MKMIFAVVLMSSAIAAAEPSKPAQQLASDDCARQHTLGKNCTLTFETTDVNGDRPPSTDIGVAVMKLDRAASLIRIRRDFIPEIIKTAEDL
jgi:hypothetical protein